VLNKHVGNMRFSDLLEQLDIEAENIAPDPPIHFGGPVDMGRGFVIHSKDYDVAEQTVKVTGSIHLTATIEILKAMARGKGPKRAVLALGYAGWAPGQLEMEIQANAWLNCAADDQLVFDEAIDRQWSRALKSLGAEALTLSTEAGHA
jgi:putative transcriptional regulator